MLTSKERDAPVVSFDETHIKCPPCGVSAAGNSLERAVKVLSKLAGLRAPAKHAPVSPSRRSVKTTAVLCPDDSVLCPDDGVLDQMTLDRIASGVFYYDGTLRLIKSSRVSHTDGHYLNIELELWIDD